MVGGQPPMLLAKLHMWDIVLHNVPKLFNCLQARDINITKYVRLKLITSLVLQVSILDMQK
jgi:hypothetical protein